MKSDRRPLPRAVIALGLTSLFTDISSEMIVPLLPVFLASLGSSTTAIGLIEGAAEATASFLKLASGWLADRVRRKKPLVLLGYGIASIARPLIGIASAPLHVLAIRLVDRVGKGIRTAPRDVMIAAAAPPGEAGRAFGLHRAMDHAGAVLGPLVASGLLLLGVALPHVFLWAALPAAIAMACLLSVPEPAAPAPIAPASRPADRALPRSVGTYLAVLFVFTIGNSTDVFLLLRARETGVSTEAIPLLWSLLHVSKVVSSYLGGEIADRIPRPRLIVMGWGIYAISYLLLAVANAAWQAWVIFVLYGVYHGLTEPAEKALVKDLAPEAVRGRAFGAYHFVIGVTAIPAGALTGWLWDRYGSFTALAIGAALAAISSVLLMTWSALERARDLRGDDPARR